MFVQKTLLLALFATMNSSVTTSTACIDCIRPVCKSLRVRHGANKQLYLYSPIFWTMTPLTSSRSFCAWLNLSDVPPLENDFCNNQMSWYHQGLECVGTICRWSTGLNSRFMAYEMLCCTYNDIAHQDIVDNNQYLLIVTAYMVLTI